MKFTVFKLRKNSLKRIYSQIEIQEKDTKILLSGVLFKLAKHTGRPREIWHEWILKDVLKNYKSKSEQYQIMYLKERYPSFLSKTWIEKDEFHNTVVKDMDVFLSWGYGD